MLQEFQHCSKKKQEITNSICSTKNICGQFKWRGSNQVCGCCCSRSSLCELTTVAAATEDCYDLHHYYRGQGHKVVGTRHRNIHHHASKRTKCEAHDTQTPNFKPEHHILFRDKLNEDDKILVETRTRNKSCKTMLEEHNMHAVGLHLTKRASKYRQACNRTGAYETPEEPYSPACFSDQRKTSNQRSLGYNNAILRLTAMKLRMDENV